MAKSMYAIEMDFANAIRQADELCRTAQSLQALVNNRFHPCLNAIASGWKGENAAAFGRKGTVLAENIKKSAQDLKTAADTIRRIAQNTYNTEKTNFEIARMRSYGGGGGFSSGGGGGAGGGGLGGR